MYLLDLLLGSALAYSPIYFSGLNRGIVEQALADPAKALANEPLQQELLRAVVFNPVFYVAMLVSYVAWRVYVYVQSPLNLVRTPNVPRKTRDQKAAEFPPPFPNGWFNVCLSQNLAKGQVKELDLFGQKLVLFRGLDGTASILDGYCPHLGANLGVAGQVNKNCLKCCFHGWEFDAEGKCVKVEGTSVIPPGSNLKKWVTKETNGTIYVWHDAEGRAPTWAMDEIEEINSGRYYCSGKTWCHVNAHVQELPENGPDSAHLNVLHKAFVWSKGPDSMSHEWSATWKPHETQSHKSDICLHQWLSLFGWTIPGTHVIAHINQIGPGIVMLHLSTPLGKLYTFEYVTPSKTTTQVVEHIMFCSQTIPRFMGKIFLWSLESQFQRDAPIWETKKYLPRPVISKADGPIQSFRRWYSQFYSPSSVSFSDALARESMMDW